MNGAHSFFLAAKLAEIGVLRRLALNCELVGAISALVHALQRERGASNMYLASKGRRFSSELADYRVDVEALETTLRAVFDRLGTEGAPSPHFSQPQVSPR